MNIFNLIYTGFGRVELVTLNSNPSAGLALKCMKKSQVQNFEKLNVVKYLMEFISIKFSFQQIVTTRQIAHIKNEKAIMLESNCDFICKLFKVLIDF